MILSCPECQKKLRINATKYAGKRLSLTCRNCGERFVWATPSALKILVAHGEEDVCRVILDICRRDVGEILTCCNASEARQILAQQSCAALLLDVALPGTFPFQLIDEIRSAGAPLKIILLPSVYNRTAYKRKPSSLYGADGYLELHHLSDGLIPMLHDLVPFLKLKSLPYCALSDEGEERPLPDTDDVVLKAGELARLLIADIALYHQDKIDQGILNGDIEQRLAVQLDEGRQMMAKRIPQSALAEKDFLLQELLHFARSRDRELNIDGVAPNAN